MIQRIGLIDKDYNGSFPNIPLMKISALHKAQNDQVEWYQPFGEEYDIVYVAKVFSKEGPEEHINARHVIRGGSGYAITTSGGGVEEYKNFAALKKMHRRGEDFISELADPIEHIYPDYSIYPTLTRDTAYGFLTRGCPRACSFCHVAAKEGTRSVKVANLQEFWNGQKNIVLCDPNILACKDWKELLQQLIDSKAWVDFNQGLDIRMMTEEKAEMLNQCKIKEVHFAWDKYEDRDKILPKLEMFRRKYEKTHKWQQGHSIVYTLVNFNTTKEQDLERIYTLRDLGYWAYIMVYDKQHNNDQFYKDIQRWVNNRFIFAKCKTIEEYINYKNTRQ